MTRQDTTTRRVTTGIVLAVGLFAGADSYAHIFELARDHGQSITSAALLPLAGDGVVAAASAVLLVASRQGHGIPLRARLLLLAGIGATAAANLAYGMPSGLTGALLSIWPVVAYVGCMELLTWMRQNTQPARTRVASADVVAPATRAASASASPDAVAQDATVNLDRERKQRRQPGGEMLSTEEKRAAETLFPTAKAGDVMPPLRAIQTAMGVGQPKAQAVQAHFRALTQAV